jgi:hypothetical protein
MSFTVTGFNTGSSNKYEVVLNANPDGSGGTVLNGTGTTFGSTVVIGAPGQFKSDSATRYNITVRDFDAHACNHHFLTAMSYCGTISINTLGDKVWRDDDKDGVQDAGEPGVAGVTVALYNSSNALVGTTTTDAYGNYLFTGLRDGSYSVGFTLPANYTFTVSNTPGDNGNNTNSDANTATGKTGSFALINGETDLTADAGIIFNTPSLTASVGDHVWLDIDADGVQDAGEPGVSGVTVTLYNSGVAVATTITDANGNYLFTNVPAASGYTVGFGLPPGFVFTTNDQGGNDNTDSDVNPVVGHCLSKMSI